MSLRHRRAEACSMLRLSTDNRRTRGRQPQKNRYHFLIRVLEDSVEGDAFFDQHDWNVFADWIQNFSVSSYQPSIQ